MKERFADADPLPSAEPVRLTMADVRAGILDSWPVIIALWIATLIGLAAANTLMGNWS